MYLDADERTNRILMIGLGEQLDIVDDLIDALDVEQKDVRTLRSYLIEHVDAEEVRNKLEELGIVTTQARAATTGRGRLSRPGSRPTPKTGAKTPTPVTTAAEGAMEEAPGEEPQVVILESTNSLLVNATKEQHLRIATIISYVDRETEGIAIPYVLYYLENQDPVSLAATLEKLVTETTEQRDAANKIVSTTKTKKT